MTAWAPETIEAVNRVNMNAPKEWKTFARFCIELVARRKDEFTSDDVDTEMRLFPDPPVTHEKRALGPVMIKAARDGIITQTDRVISSNRSKLHNSPRRVWRSLLYKEPAI